MSVCLTSFLSAQMVTIKMENPMPDGSSSDIWELYLTLWSLKFVQIIFEYSVSMSEKTHCASITRTITEWCVEKYLLFILRKMWHTWICSAGRMEEFLDLKASDMYSYHGSFVVNMCSMMYQNATVSKTCSGPDSGIRWIYLKFFMLFHTIITVHFYESN
jgi:hypothetical protein